MDYKILVKDSSNITIGEFDTFRNLKFGKRLNNYSNCSFDIPVNDLKAASLVSLRRYTVWIYRDDDLVWSGEQALREGNLTNQGNNWATIHCFDWLEQLNSRYTDDYRRFDVVDASEIAWTLIDETQTQTNGSLGITEGTLEETMDRDRSYYNQNIYEAIINLSNVYYGFDFEITNNKVFNTYVFKGEDKTNDVIFQYGKNITSARIIEDFVRITNRAIVLGEVDGEDSLQRIERNDTTSQGLYKIREYLINEMNITELDTFEEKGDSLLRKYKSPLFKIDIDLAKSSVSIVDFSVGDAIKLKIQTGIYDIDSDYRVYEWEISYGTDNTEILSLVLGDFILS
jgi:hypothetical protein